MPLLADKTITVRNLRYDPETDTEAEITTRLEGCSVHAKTVANATADGLAAASLAQIRILPGTRWRPRRALLRPPSPQTTSSSPLPHGLRRAPPLRRIRGHCGPETISSTRASG